MSEPQREHTTVVTTGGGGSAGWFILGGLVVAIVVFFAFGGIGLFDRAGGADIDVDVNLPKVVQPAN